jgi:hypothetical protein
MSETGISAKVRHAQDGHVITLELTDEALDRLRGGTSATLYREDFATEMTTQDKVPVKEIKISRR